MDTQINILLDSLVDQIKDPKQLEAVKEQLYKRAIQSLLSAEMEVHLGYAHGEKPLGDNLRNGFSQKTLQTTGGEITIDVPRDRKASFEPTIVPKHRTMNESLEQTVLLLYAKGMSTSDIVDFMDRTYGVKYSTSQVSILTNRLLDEIRDWQKRPLDTQYAVVWLDAIHYKIRQENKVVSKAAMLVIGINMEGVQDLLGIYIVENESSSEWSKIMTDIQQRGIEDVLFMCSDNLTGIQKAVESIFPKTVHQICIVHQVRNTFKYVSHKDKKEVVKDMKTIYQADNIQMAEEALEIFKSKWQTKYSIAVNSWVTNWDALTAFLQYPKEIRKLIYTTNVIESFNSNLRKYTQNKKVFPNDDSALKSIWLAMQQINPKWQKKRFNWSQIYNQLYIYFENRILNQNIDL
jgi:putative transposase